MYRIWPLLLALYAVLPAGAQDFSLLQKEEFLSRDGERILPYRILYPEGYDGDVAYPLVLFLHGGGERGTDNEKQLVHGVKEFLARRAEFPCILVVPQCPSDSYWASVRIDRSRQPLALDFNYREYEITPALELAVELTRHLIETENIDKKRVYVTGLSMGGMGTLEAAYRFPKLFAAAVPICGGGDAAAFKKKHSRIPYWLFHGEADNVIAAEESRAMVARLTQLGAEVKYTEYPGVGHNSWEAAYADPELLPWLFGQRR